MKIITKIVTLLVALSISLSAFGCSGSNNDDGPNADQTLEIFVTNAGYGIEWLNDTIEAFKEQDWVKEKYPNLTILEPQINTVSNWIDSKITSGLKANSIDLFFSCQSIGSQYNKKDKNGNSYFEDLYEDVYNSEVPGENIKVKDKMNSQIFEQSKITLLDGSTVYYAMPWINGMMGLMYNRTKINQYLGEDYVMPRTTNELVQCFKSLKTKLPSGDAPFIFTGTGSRYFNASFQVWWAQYEGLSQYTNFWNGVDEEGTFSNSIFSQKGRLRSLEVCESLANKDNGFNHEYSTTGIYTEVQANFLNGNMAVFIPNGDWLYTESVGTFEINQDIRMLKMPVISSITEKLQVVKSDDALAYVVQCVDDGKTFDETAAGYTYGGTLTQYDFNYISNARNMMYRMTGHEAFIPSYAKGKEVAKDFLRFMATDIGIQAFAKSTYGLQTPYNYTQSEETVKNYSGIQQDHYEYLKTAVLLPPESIFRLNYLGGLNPMTKCPAIMSAFGCDSKKDRKSAEKVYNDDINYYTEATFKSTLIKAGLN